MRLPPLEEASAREAGGKAWSLGRLARDGFPVPPGFVVPSSLFARALEGGVAPPQTSEEDGSRREPELRPDPALRGVLARALADLPGGVDAPVAVRSSATDEDGASTSFAGQHDSVLGVSGPQAVEAAVLRCWASWFSARALAYRGGAPAAGGMAVLVQSFVDADASGVLFTGGVRMLEAVHGLGEGHVSGQITPEAWWLEGDGIHAHRRGTARSRSVRRGNGVRHEDLPVELQERAVLTRAQVLRIDGLGREVEANLGLPIDLEWSLVADGLHLLQARPVTASPPTAPAEEPVEEPVGEQGPHARLTGIAASGGAATGSVRHVRSTADFSRVHPGDILVARATDPAWTPLFGVVAAVVTETGGALSHAAIVAREVGIPAVLAVPGALEHLVEGTEVQVDGARGTVTPCAGEMR